ncbi:MAG: hypothetical protein GY718_00050 [Lentisphaerae bacterium]|nr:hypothetical protein [Lentisphaerota bacterium]
MYIEIPDPQCSKCGNKHSETFQRKAESGRRCLSCGHENVMRAPADRIGGVAWQLDTRKREF